MFAKKIRLLICVSVLSLFLMPQITLAGDVYAGTGNGKEYWLVEETIVREEGIYKADTKDVRDGALDSVTHWKFVTDGRHWYFLRSKNEQQEQTAGSPVNIKRSALAQTIFQYCVDFIGNSQ
ncbi:MAG: hypothetical protein IJS96_06310 [Schwartzia sp.]|nr:hypothetical protein [Schwartzia sp. (in: firmicutes)]